MRLRSWMMFFLCAVLLHPANARAESTSDGKATWYGSAQLGGALTGKVFDETESVFFFPSVSTPVTLSTDPGIAGTVALGYKTRSGFRMEGEVGYRRNSFADMTIGTTMKPLGGSIACTSFMANVSFEFEAAGGVAPHIGVGIGTSTKSIEVDANPADPTWAGDAEVALGGEKNASHTALQFNLGLARALNDVLDVTLDYKYFDPIEADLIGLDFDYNNSNITVGLRYNFNR